MRWTHLAGVLASFLLASAAVSPPAQTPSDSKPPVAGYEHVEIRLAQFDVVVRDKAGKMVTGLGPTDFSVYEDGVPLEIVAVDEWGREMVPPLAARPAPPPPSSAGAAAPTPAAIPKAEEPERRSFVIVFDAIDGSSALRMSQAKRAAQGFVQNHVRPDDLAAVYQLDLSLRPLCGITSDRDQLAKAIGKVAWMPGSTLQDDIAESILTYDSAGTNPLMKQRLTAQASNATSELAWTRDHVYDTLDGLAQLFQALPGRRILVVVSAGFAMTTPGDAKDQSGGFTPKFQELIRSLSKYGVTAYTLDIGDENPAGDVTQPIDWRNAVGKMGLDENLLSDIGLERSLGTASASSRREFLGVLAGETGGRMLTATDLTRDFETIQEESVHFYRVACRVSVTKDTGRYRKTVVKMRPPGLSVTTRRGRYSDIVPADRTERAGSTALESLDKYRPLAVRGIALPLPTADPKKVPVAVVMETLGPVEVAADAQGVGSLDVEFRLVARAAGEVVDRYERSFTAKLKPEHIGPVRGGFRVEGRLALVPGIYEFQGTVRLANPPQLATWTSTIAVPLPPKGLAPGFDGVLVWTDSEPASPLLTRPTIPDDSDALVLGAGHRVLPPTSPDFDAGGSLLAVFWLRGVPEVDGKPRLDLGVKVLDAAGKPMELPTELLAFGKEPTGGYRGLARLDVTALSPGPYTLRVEATAPGAPSPSARQTVVFTLHAREATPPSAAVTSSSEPGATSSRP